MSILRLAFLRLAFSGLALLALASQRGIAASDPNASTVHFMLRADSVIALPVKVNGAGPFQFLLDTGTTETAVDSALANQLKLPITGREVTATLKKSSLLLTVRADKLDLADAEVRDLDLLVVPMNGILSHYPGARGVLGENFLRNFDLLLDHRHQLLQLQKEPGLMGETLTGQHVPFNTLGGYHGGTTENRLILALNVPEFSAEPLTFQLDSGASALILFTSAYRESLRLQAADVPIVTLNKFSPTDRHRLRTLLVGNIRLGNVRALTSAQGEVPDVDGLLPTSLFQSVHISHSGGYAIFNPGKVEKGIH